MANWTCCEGRSHADYADGVTPGIPYRTGHAITMVDADGERDWFLPGAIPYRNDCEACTEESPPTCIVHQKNLPPRSTDPLPITYARFTTRTGVIYIPCMGMDQLIEWYAKRDDKNITGDGDTWHGDQDAMEGRVDDTMKVLDETSVVNDVKKSGDGQGADSGQQEHTRAPKRHRPGHTARRWTRVKEKIGMVGRGLISEKDLSPQAWVQYNHMKGRFHKIESPT